MRVYATYTTRTYVRTKEEHIKTQNTMKNLNFMNHENGSEGLNCQGLVGLRVAQWSRIGTRSLRNTLLPVLIGTLLLTLGVGQMGAL